jgi:GGDEF domain-containing protein
MIPFSSRHNEGVILVTQNNILRTLTVVGMNAYMQTLLGYENIIENASLSQFLGTKIEKEIEEDLEYEDDAKDLMQVLSKHSSIKLLRQNGLEVTLHCHVTRAMARDRNHLFRLVLSPIHQTNKIPSITSALKQSFLGHEILDKETHLPNDESMMMYIRLTQNFIHHKEISACFVYMQWADDKTISLSSHKILSHIGRVIARNLREDDTIARLDSHAIGMLLVDVNPTTVYLALNRIHHMVINDPIPMEDGLFYTPAIRQAAVMLRDQSPSDMVTHCLSLLADASMHSIAVVHSQG